MSYSKADADVISGKLTPMSYCTIGPLSGPVPRHAEAGRRRRGTPETPRSRTFTGPHPRAAETWPRHALTPAAPSGVPAIRPGERGTVTAVAASPRPWLGRLPAMVGHPRAPVRSAPRPEPIGAGLGRAPGRFGRPAHAGETEFNSVLTRPGETRWYGRVRHQRSSAARAGGPQWLGADPFGKGRPNPRPVR